MSVRKRHVDDVSPQSGFRRDFLKTAAAGGVLLSAGLLSPAPASAQTGEDVLQKVIRTKQLNVVVNTYPLITFKEGGELKGSFVDAAKWLASQMEVSLNLIETEFANFIAMIQSGRADVSLSSSYATVARAMAVDFTQSILWFGSGALVRNTDVNKWKTLEDADQPGVRVLVREGSGYHKPLVVLLKKAKLIVTAPTVTLTQQPLDVLSNRADVLVSDDWLIRKMVQTHKGRLAVMAGYVDKPWSLNASSWSVAKGQTAMLNVLNVAIDRLRENNMFQQWDEKYGGAQWAYKKEFFYTPVKG